MDRRFLLFLLAALFVWQANMLFWAWVNPQPQRGQPEPPAVAQQDAPPDEAEPPPQPAVEDQPPPEQPADPQQSQPRAWLTLGSADPDSEYSMLVTLTNRGAAVARIELNSPRYRDIERRYGYIGLYPDNLEAVDEGVKILVVGPGTPAHQAGLEAGDILTHAGERPLKGTGDLQAALRGTRPGEVVQLRLAGRNTPMEVATRHHPLQIVSPENPEHLSLETTLRKLDDRELAEDQSDLEGLPLSEGNWQVAQREGRVEFRWLIPAKGVEVIKSYWLPPRDAVDAQGNPLPDHHLALDVRLRYTGQQQRTVAYRLDGPNGLPVEGEWYAYKVSPYWSSVGLRDVAWKFHGASTSLVSAASVAEGEAALPAQAPVQFAGVDAQYFSSILVPQKVSPDELWIHQAQWILVNEGTDPRNKQLVNTSVRLDSVEFQLSPESPEVEHRYWLFAGPKKSDVLAQYGLSDLLYYGWFWWVAIPMAGILHFFHAIIPNYGIAIILLTVLVRSAMFPLSKKQALNAQKMQLLQPEMKRIAEQYKKDPEKRIKATQDLYRKHNFNPMSGCLPLFIQLPIFIGLYRSLAVDIELRQASLLGEGIRWCSNLAAPDMLFRWDGFMPGFVVHFLGPYFNLLPVVTIVLFLWQQKMFMPPALDEQARVQQKVMQYMMVFMGLLFFRIPSGLCIYFIASSLWGLAERKMLPKAAPQAAGTQPAAAAEAKLATPAGNGAAARRKGKKKQHRR